MINSFNNWIVANKNQVSSEVLGETVILNMTSGIYYGLNETGTFIWNLIQEPKTVEYILSALLDEYEAKPEECKSDLLALIQDLADKGMIEIKDEASMQIITP
ncbi:MAG: PqqD family protein [Chlorogloeopsis fritschii C42_A2020_084]|uniref:PqqD family protein n=1 Tax=Chlorogloeopsis fritschii TaxID=1124 RepID=UPI001A0411EA|nr:PqqD family protein [Chlorogloeopsis fritschii]MBF2004238.1 PqqD family protein [Chlorogloeopsis fritschii C42_A2020_084]